MSLTERFPHMSLEQLARYESMLANSPARRRCADVVADDTHLKSESEFFTAGDRGVACRYRGSQRGTCELRRCCGQPAVDPVDVWECELLKGGCVLYGTPIESDIETCSTCSDRQPA